MDTVTRSKRRLKALELRESGMKWREVGAHFGVSASRARQLAECGRRIRQHPRWDEIKHEYGY